jgi:hypothetical protein
MLDIEKYESVKFLIMYKEMNGRKFVYSDMSKLSKKKKV